MTGLARKVRIAYGFFAQPNDLYDIINTAQDPDGVYYWKFVDEGTGPKIAGSKPFMVFMVDGHLIRKEFVAGNPAVNMRERAIPDIREYFKKRLREVKLLGKNADPSKLTLEWLDGVFLDTALMAKEILAELTPVLQDKYTNDDPIYGTPAAGLLKESYKVIKKDTGEEVG